MFVYIAFSMTSSTFVENKMLTRTSFPDFTLSQIFYHFRWSPQKSKIILLQYIVPSLSQPNLQLVPSCNVKYTALIKVPPSPFLQQNSDNFNCNSNITNSISRPAQVAQNRKNVHITEIFMTSWRHCKLHHSSCLLETHCRTTHYRPRHSHEVPKS